ncbi:MAG: ElyC/SanA/YdcF family protein, partial [Bacteroidota bacterium]
MYLGLLSLFVVLLTMINNDYINNVTRQKLFTNIDLIPVRKTGLLLGTVKNLANGQTNLYFSYRIQAAADLYHAGKIEQLIVSGDSSRKDYNEPADMQEALIALGVPAERIHLDYAGFRSLDSVVRANAIFDMKEFTVISQPFHNARAVYIAQQK